MSKEQNNQDADMLDEYDFSGGGVCGKYARQYAEGTNIVLPDPDMASNRSSKPTAI